MLTFNILTPSTKALIPRAIASYCKSQSVLPCKPDALTCSFTLKSSSRAMAINELFKYILRDVTCWNAMIAGLAQGDRSDEAL
ncbi:hypothetical protein Hanom_Chr09g00809741 [Helianthus anomalus]